MRRLSKEARRTLLEDYCRRLGPGFRIDGTCESCWTDIAWRVDDDHEVEVLNYEVHLRDGMDIVQVNLWHAPLGDHRSNDIEMASVGCVPNDPTVVREVARRLAARRHAFSKNRRTVACNYPCLDEALAPFEGVAEGPNPTHETASIQLPTRRDGAAERSRS